MFEPSFPSNNWWSENPFTHFSVPYKIKNAQLDKDNLFYQFKIFNNTLLATAIKRKKPGGTRVVLLINNCWMQPDKEKCDNSHILQLFQPVIHRLSSINL